MISYYDRTYNIRVFDYNDNVKSEYPIVITAMSYDFSLADIDSQIIRTVKQHGNKHGDTTVLIDTAASNGFNAFNRFLAFDVCGDQIKWYQHEDVQIINNVSKRLKQFQLELFAIPGNTNPTIFTTVDKKYITDHSRWNYEAYNEMPNDQSFNAIEVVDRLQNVLFRDCAWYDKQSGWQFVHPIKYPIGGDTLGCVVRWRPWV